MKEQTFDTHDNCVMDLQACECPTAGKQIPTAPVPRGIFKVLLHSEGCWVAETESLTWRIVYEV